MGTRDTGSFRDTVGALGLVVVLLTGFALVPRVFARQEGPMVGQAAPDFALPIIANGAALAGEGEPLRLTALRGQAVLLDFWATWCGPCRAEAPIVERVSRRWRDRGVVVLGVDTDAPDQGDPREFAAAHGLSYPIVRDTVGLAQRSYEVDSLPTLVVVSRTGKIVAVRTGVTDDGEIERLIRQAL